jgi:hypothetical protein
MWRTASNQAKNTLKTTFVCKVLTTHALPCYSTPARLIRWLKQLRLLSNNPSTWSTTWNGFHETYMTLMNETHINDSINGSSNTKIDEHLVRAIHVDVIRLSRYYDVFCDDEEDWQSHVKRLERILLVFAQYSAANSYKQGYHELLVLLYSVAVKDGFELGLNMDECESVAYFLLHALINGTIVGDFFIDYANSSLLDILCQKATQLLNICDQDLAQTFDSNNISILFFAIPWINVMFSQMYSLPLLLKLWDFLFDQIENLQTKLVNLVVAHLVTIRKMLIGCEFKQILTQLTRLTIDTEAQFSEIGWTFQKIQLLSNT